MRLAALSLSALMISACSESASNEPRVELPLKAPDQAHNLVVDFIEVCSLSLIKPKEGVELAESRGWVSETAGSDIMMNIAGVAVLSDETSGATLQIIPAVYPHLDTKMCMILLPYADDFEEDLKLDIIHQTAGLQGGFIPVPGGDDKGIGRWSFIASNGQTVVVNAMRPTSSIVQMNMSTHKHLNPN